MKKVIFIFIYLSFIISACNGSTNEPTELMDFTPTLDKTTEYKATSTPPVSPTIIMEKPTKTYTNSTPTEQVEIMHTPSPWPTLPMAFTPNPEQINRWPEYEKALAKELIPAPEPTKILCEWITLGQVEDEIYVWAYCQVDDRIPTGASEPVVIYLGEDGEIRNTDSPRSGSYYPPDVERLFPPDIQKYIFNQGDWLNVQSLKEHIQYRLEHPGEPPLWIQP